MIVRRYVLLGDIVSGTPTSFNGC